MNCKKIPVVFLIFFSFLGLAQNRQLSYGFAEMPNTLLLNPGAETNYKFHVGVPLLSDNSFQFNSTEFKVSDLFINDNVDFNLKFENLIDKLTQRDFINFNTQLHLLNGGIRLNNKMYLSFGLYQDIDFISYYPKDIVELMYYGNNHALHKTIYLSEVKFKADAVGVIHAGLSYKLDKKLTIGGRLKLYSGGLHFSSLNNSGTFTTVETGNNIYRHYLSNVNATVNTYGLIDENDDFDFDANQTFKNMLFGKNLGFGIDVGFTYHYSPQIQVTGSILDLGFVSYSKEAKKLTSVGDYQLDGVELLFDGTVRDYLAEIEDDFKNQVDSEINEASFVSWRPVKLYGAVSYSFGRARQNKECYDNTYKEYFVNSLGLQLFAVKRPVTTQLAATLFYERSISENFHTKITYTVDDYSYSNVGIGISTQVGIFQVYGLLDNVLKLSDLSKTTTSSLQFGVNLIFN